MCCQGWLHTVSLAVLPLTVTVLTRKSTPIVLVICSSKVSSVNRSSRLLLPTPESPMRRILKMWSKEGAPPSTAILFRGEPPGEVVPKNSVRVLVHVDFPT